MPDSTGQPQNAFADINLGSALRHCGLATLEICGKLPERKPVRRYCRATTLPPARSPAFFRITSDQAERFGANSRTIGRRSKLPVKPKRAAFTNRVCFVGRMPYAEWA